MFARRIMGVETEYGVTAFRDGAPVLSPEEVARYLFRPVVAEHRSSNIFVDNASRLYLDVGAHPEYATAECDSITQLLNSDKAGELIFDRLSRKAEKSLAADGIGGEIYLFKNNVDSRGNSYGAHENYLISREFALKPFSLQLLPHMITRQLICGAGLIKKNRFVISQRADQVWEGVSSATTRTRPIINTRDEPHGDSRRFRRMHVIVGDSSMAEPTFALKIGSTLLVIEMLEAGVDMPRFELDNPIEHIRDIAADPTGQTPLRLKDGGMVTALEVQAQLLDAARTWLARRPDEGTPNEEMARVVDLWGRTVEAVETQDFSGVDREIDWVIKRKLLEQFKQRLDCGWDHPKLAHIDLAYHDIRRSRSLFYHLQNKGLVKRWTTDDAIEAAVSEPPQTTRAALRGRFLAAARDNGAATNVDWVHLKVNHPEPRTVELADPFANGGEAGAQVEDLIDYMRLSARTVDTDTSRA